MSQNNQPTSSPAMAAVQPLQICPSCGGSSIHRSRTRGAAEQLLKLAGMRAYRCWDCDNRFLRIKGWTRVG